ncbi:MAG: hypothetical protein K0S70_5124, partial [Microbacterium sp.]|nr:hypothetical protein [Microbacterium sp.]
VGATTAVVIVLERRRRARTYASAVSASSTHRTLFAAGRTT